MFENMNPLDKSTAWLEIFILMFGAFLIGYYFARFYYRRRYKNELEDCIAENQRLKFEESEIVLDEDQNTGIRAIKTRDRTGKPIESEDEIEETLPVKPAKQPELNFDNIGEANPSQADDLTRIKGIGPFIEEKLNNIGIYTIEQISRLSESDKDALNNKIEYLPNQIQEEEWVEQAKDLLNQNSKTKKETTKVEARDTKIEDRKANAEKQKDLKASAGEKAEIVKKPKPTNQQTENRKEEKPTQEKTYTEGLNIEKEKGPQWGTSQRKAEEKPENDNPKKENE